MTRRIVWAPKATHDLLAAIDYIEVDSPMNAASVAERVLKRVASLADMPTGRPGRVANTYEASVTRTNLIIAFELPDKSTIHILRIIHARRNWPKGEWPE